MLRSRVRRQRLSLSCGVEPHLQTNPKFLIAEYMFKNVQSARKVFLLDFRLGLTLRVDSPYAAFGGWWPSLVRRLGQSFRRLCCSRCSVRPGVCQVSRVA